MEDLGEDLDEMDADSRRNITRHVKCVTVKAFGTYISCSILTTLLN